MANEGRRRGAFLRGAGDPLLLLVDIIGNDKKCHSEMSKQELPQLKMESAVTELWAMPINRLFIFSHHFERARELF